MIMQFKNFYNMRPAESVADKFKRALGLHQSGRLDEAAKLYQDILRQQPHHFDALHLLGVISAQTGNYPQAAQLISSALGIDGHHAGAHTNLGNALKEMGRPDQALASFCRAIVLWPDLAEAFHGGAEALLAQGLIDPALSLCRRAIKLLPGYIDARITCGQALNAASESQQAVSQLQIALAFFPAAVQAFIHLGISAHNLLREEWAARHFQRACWIAPQFLGALNNLGNAQLKLSRFDDALTCYSQAIVLQPDYADAYSNLASALDALGRSALAGAHLEIALVLQPQHFNAWYNLGNIYKKLVRLDRAIECYGMALNHRADFADALAQKLYLEAMICDWRGFADHQNLLSDLGIATAAINPFGVLALEDQPARHKHRSISYVRQNLGRAIDRKFGKPFQRPTRLRIGYFSTDFHDHAVMHLAAGLFEHHDKARFEIHAFNYSARPEDAMRQRIARAVDQFHSLAKHSDSAIADIAAGFNIDIAVDLSGHTQDARLGILAHRPAPIQITYLGYPGTTGADFIDYLIADRFVIPDDGPEDEQKSCTENLIFMPDCYQVNDDRRPIASTRPTKAELGLPERGVVFCCFNNTFKISPREFDIWMRLLAANDGAVLWLLNTNPWAKANLQAHASSRGINPDRLIFAPLVSAADHLARHDAADMFLDTFNYNAHTTASDALRCGLPVITKAGRGFPARVAGSLLSTLGLPELITQTEAEYESLAMALARDPARLVEVKTKIAQNLKTAPLFNTGLFTRHLEAAYDQVFNKYLAT